MSDEYDFRIRPGRIGSSKRQRTKSAIAQALVAAKLAGGLVSRRGHIVSPRTSTFGRGRIAAVRAGHRMGNRSRVAIIKTRVVRMSWRGSLGSHLSYLQRDGVTRDGERGQLFGTDSQDVDPIDFANRCENDRHHFRFIVSPEDAPEMADLRGFTRELMGQMEKDLGTRLDWAAVDHWNTEHPHYSINPDPSTAVIGKLIDRGLHEELTGSAYAIIDGIDGRTHHLTFSDIDATTDCRPGSIVELRRFEDRKGRARTALAVRSDLDLQRQITAPGATWLDHRNLNKGSVDLGGGFGAEVRNAMEARAEHLADIGLARRQGQRIIFARNLLDTLKGSDLEATARRLSSEMGIPYNPSKSGEYVMGTVRRQLNLASGRYAMIDNGLGFALVPWSPSLDKQIGKHISGVMRGDGGVDWSFGRGRGLGL